MPRFLLLMTLGGFAALTMAIVYPSLGLDASGRAVNSPIWRDAGNWIAFVLPALILGVSSGLMMFRLNLGRLLFAAGWIAMSIGFYVAKPSGVMGASMLVPEFVFISTLTISIFLYLYVSPSVRRYFSPHGDSRE
ncbi:hypothetical protein [Xanthomonas bundabergensis]|uniref:hypothetical protein n=1 Tax=Xanthomonas bundabergensis TaxID=3160842 RepID=UPI003516010F